MADDLKFWRSRLAVVVNAGPERIPVTPIDSFSPSFSLNADVLHSIEKTHIGVVYSPQSITFSMTVKAIGPAVGKLTSMALKGERFDVVLQETDDGNDWSFKEIVLSDCIITSATPTSASVSGAPTATFSGMSLAASASPKVGAEVGIP
jgi:hypothetical protein